jgi:hypothetical protein
MTQWRDCTQFTIADMPPTAAESVRTWQWVELLAAKEAACGISYGAFWADFVAVETGMCLRPSKKEDTAD